jgi:stage V sporulation protein R
VAPRGHLPAKLRHQARITESAARSVGLDFFEVVFEMLDAADVNAVAAYGGFPVRYPSWRFGMHYERLQKGYEYGLSKIYELVINNDPTYAYLVRSNSMMEQKLVMAHVMGHADFFKHNVWFGPTQRSMVEQMSYHAARIRSFVEVYGQDKVERFLDVALGLDELIDPYLPLRESRRADRKREAIQSPAERVRLDFERRWGDGAEDPHPGPQPIGSAPPTRSSSDLPTFDILGFLVEHACLADWQVEILRIVRAEAYYFLPQRLTKIMNEGWASYWHSHLLTHGLLGPSEIVDFADCHAGATAVAPGQLNPYKLGIELFRHAHARGDDLFQLRRVHNDVSFIDHVVDEDFARSNQLFVYRRNARTGKNVLVDRDWVAIKEQLLRELSWCGSPRIQLVEADADGEGGLLLVHQHEGRDLKLDEAGAQLKTLAQVWGGPVHLLTLEEGTGRRISTDGQDVSVIETTRAQDACGGEEAARAS